MAFGLTSIESAVAVVFLSLVSYLFFKPDPSTIEFTKPINRGTDLYIVLRDGRKLFYCDQGPLTGYPVLHFHPMPASRLFSHPDAEEILGRLSVRLITPDRPGIGMSSPHPDRTLLDWADDIEELITHLNLPYFAVSGHSAGASHALAVAYKFPDRVTKVACIGGALFPSSFGESPKDEVWQDLYDGMRPLNKMIAVLGADYEWLLSILWTVSSGLIIDVNTTIKDITSHSFEADLDQPQWTQHLRAAFLESYRQGTLSHLQELTLISKPWGFRLEDVRQPVTIWHAMEDTSVSRAMAEYLNFHLPRSDLNFIHEVGHWALWANYFQKILKDLTEE